MGNFRMQGFVIVPTSLIAVLLTAVASPTNVTAAPPERGEPVVVTVPLDPEQCRRLDLGFDFDVNGEAEINVSALTTYFDQKGTPIADRQRLKSTSTTFIEGEPDGNVVGLDQKWVRTRDLENDIRVYNGNFLISSLNGKVVNRERGRVVAANSRVICEDPVLVVWDFISSSRSHPSWETECSETVVWSVCQMLSTGEPALPTDAPDDLCICPVSPAP